MNLSDALGMQGRYADAAETARDGIALAERVGRRAASARISAAA